MKAKLKAAIIFTIVLFDCSSSEFTVYSHPDAINKFKTNFNSTEFLIYQSPLNESSVFDVYASFSCEKSDTASHHRLSIKYSGTPPLYLESLELETDYSDLKLEPDRLPMRHQDGVRGIAEVISVELKEPVIEDLLANKKSELRLIGESVRIEFFLLNDFYINLAKFYNSTK